MRDTIILIGRHNVDKPIETDFAGARNAPGKLTTDKHILVDIILQCKYKAVKHILKRRKQCKYKVWIDCYISCAY